MSNPENEVPATILNYCKTCDQFTSEGGHIVEWYGDIELDYEINVVECDECKNQEP